MGFVRVHFIPCVQELGFPNLLDASANFTMALLGVIGGLLAGGISDRPGRHRPMSLPYACVEPRTSASWVWRCGQSYWCYMHPLFDLLSGPASPILTLIWVEEAEHEFFDQTRRDI
jgi:hypothetical protein